MIPEPDHALKTIAGTLMMTVAPNVGDPYHQANASLLAIVALFIAREYERAAEIHTTENREMRALFARGAATVTDEDLRRRLTAAAQSVDPSLRLSELTAANHTLRRRLIELHAAVEEQGTAAAVELEGAIWRFLCAAAERRTINFG